MCGLGYGKSLKDNSDLSACGLISHLRDRWVIAWENFPVTAQVERASRAQELADWFGVAAANEADDLLARTAIALGLIAGRGDGVEDEADDEFVEEFDDYSSVDTRFEPPRMPAAVNDNLALRRRRRG